MRYFIPALALAMLLFSGCISLTPEAVPGTQLTQNITATPNSAPLANQTSGQPELPAPAENETVPLRDEAESFATSTSTYAFDGSGLELSGYSDDTYTFTFSSGSSGYGNRSGLYPDGKPTPHILVIKNNGSFYSAVVDGVYDEIRSILLAENCPPAYKKYSWENDSFCYVPGRTDGMPCTYTGQCIKGGCLSRSDGSMGPRGICSDFMYGCHVWLYEQTVTRVDACKSKDYP